MSEFKIPRFIFYVATLAATIFFIDICNKLGVSISLSSIISASVLLLTNISIVAFVIIKFFINYLKDYREEQRRKDSDIKQHLSEISQKISLMNQVLLEHVEQSHSQDESDITKLKLSK